MNSDLVPAIVASGGGSALITSIWVYEHRRDEAMRESRLRLGLRFPLHLEPPRAIAALEGLAGLSYTNELIAEVAASEGAIEHFLWVPAALRASAEAILSGVIGSLRISEAPSAPTDGVTLCLRLYVPSPTLLAADGAMRLD